eukprot:746305-Hanusia_phi.AAC.1
MALSGAERFKSTRPSAAAAAATIRELDLINEQEQIDKLDLIKYLDLINELDQIDEPDQILPAGILWVGATGMGCWREVAFLETCREYFEGVRDGVVTSCGRKGGETGKQTVRDMKALLKDTADKTQLQNKLASKLLGKAAQNVHSAKARAAAAAAAAEIAKILDVPSARDIVEGRSRQQQPPSHAKAKHTQTLKIATWLKTPKGEIVKRPTSWG